jgi:sulfonate transport system substrate-binding protein
VGTLPSSEYLPQAVMTAKGFASGEGLKLISVPEAGGAAILEAVAQGVVDTGNPGTIPVIQAAARGRVPNEVLPVAATCFSDPQHPGTAVLVPPSVKSWQDLEGKPLAIRNQNAAAMLIRLQDEGVRCGELVEIPFANMGLAVHDGSVAAAALIDPYLAQSLQRGDGRVLGYVIGGPPFERFQLSMMVFRTRLARERPQLVVAYLRAYIRAIRWINRHPAEAERIQANQLNLDAAVVAKIIPPLWRDPPRNDPEILKALQEKLEALGWLQEPIPPERLFDESFLDAALSGRRPKD